MTNTVTVTPTPIITGVTIVTSTPITGAEVCSGSLFTSYNSVITVAGCVVGSVEYLMLMKREWVRGLVNKDQTPLLLCYLLILFLISV